MIVSAADEAKLPQEMSLRLPIIMYHATIPNLSNKHTITPTQLEKDFANINERGYTPIFVSDLLDYIDGKTLVPDKPIMITFDDGYYNNYKFAYPLIKKYDIKCIFSVVGKYIDDNYTNGEYTPTYAHTDYQQLKEMHASGLVEIQSHTYNMHSSNHGRLGAKIKRWEAPTKYTETLKNDLLKLHDNIKKETGINITALAYPFGHYCKESTKCLQELGYRVAFTCNEGINNINNNTNLRLLYRINRDGCWDSSVLFRKLEKYK